MKYFIVLMAGYLVADVDCGVRKMLLAADKIVNGSDASEGEFPW